MATPLQLDFDYLNRQAFHSPEYKPGKATIPLSLRQAEFVESFVSQERRNAIFTTEDYMAPPVMSAESHFRATLPNFKIEFDGTARLDPTPKPKVKLHKQRLLVRLNHEKPLKPLAESPRRKNLERASLKHS